MRSLKDNSFSGVEYIFKDVAGCQTLLNGINCESGLFFSENDERLRDEGEIFFNNKRLLMQILPNFKAMGVRLISISFQGGGTFDAEEKRLKNPFSVYRCDGTINTEYFSAMTDIIYACQKNNICVIVALFDSAHEMYISDQYYNTAALFNIIDELCGIGADNLLISIAGFSQPQFKRIIFSDASIIKFIGYFKEKYRDKIIIGSQLSKKYAVTKNLEDYIKYSDFIPLYSRKGYNTRKMLEDIYFFRSAFAGHDVDKPLIVTRGDDLNEKYNTYGQTNLAAAAENNVSWLYYDENLDFGHLNTDKLFRFENEIRNLKLV